MTAHPRAKPIIAAVSACALLVSSIMITGCDSSTPTEKLASYIEENGDERDGVTRLEIPFKETNSDLPAVGTYEYECELVYDGDRISMEVVGTSETASLSSGLVVETAFDLPEEDGTECNFTHSACLNLAGTEYLSEGSGVIDLAEYKPCDDIEFDEYDAAGEIDLGAGASASTTTSDGSPGGSFVPETQYAIESGLNSLSALLESKELGFNLADLGIESFESTESDEADSESDDSSSDSWDEILWK